MEKWKNGVVVVEGGLASRGVVGKKRDSGRRERKDGGEEERSWRREERGRRAREHFVNKRQQFIVGASIKSSNHISPYNLLRQQGKKNHQKQHTHQTIIQIWKKNTKTN